MFCSNCGTKVPDDSKFCQSCGTPIAASSSPKNDDVKQHTPEASRPVYKAPVNEEPIDAEINFDSEEWRKVIGKNHEYYIPEFQRIARGEKQKFNKAAFFLGPYNCLYRKSINPFIKRYFVSFLLSLLAGIIMICSASSIAVGGMIFSAVLIFAASIWGLISIITMGLNFNKLYFEECKQRIAQKDVKKYGTSIVYPIVFIVLIYILTALVAAYGGLSTLFFIF